MENAILEDVVQRLNRLEKIVTEVDKKLSRLVERIVPDVPEDCETGTPMKGTNTQNNSQDTDIGAEVIEGILVRMGYPPDFDPGPLEEVRKSMVASGIRPEDNEFSQAIIAEREK